MSFSYYDSNFTALLDRFPSVAGVLDNACGTSLYTGLVRGRTGNVVPTLTGDKPVHSLYNQDAETARLLEGTGEDSFVVFGGIGSGEHIRKFLAVSGSSCVLVERDPSSFKKLLDLVPLSDLFQNTAVREIIFLDAEELAERIATSWIPVLHSNFLVIALRPWLDSLDRDRYVFDQSMKRVVTSVSADYSVQAHFGKQWFRNIVGNLAIASQGCGVFPEATPGKTAIIAAAGPSLEQSVNLLKKRRKDVYIFATDTAYSSLLSFGIKPDAFVSIDAQPYSAYHGYRGFSPETKVILDLCASTALSHSAVKSGIQPVFTCGNHPLARYAASWGPLPLMDTSSGTVTFAAYNAAQRAGFTDIELTGADFAYTGGKAYARGTYLDAIFGKEVDRYSPYETLWINLMFRTQVRSIRNGLKIDYHTDVLDSYARFATSLRFQQKQSVWSSGKWPFNRFLEEYRELLFRDKQDPLNSRVLETVLPLAAWNKRRAENAAVEHNLRLSFNLALELIERYTVNQ